MTIRSNSQNGDTQTATVAVIITAAGSSTRMGGTKKEYLPLGKGTVLSQCIKAFMDASGNKEHPFNISRIVITVPTSGTDKAKQAASPAHCPIAIDYVEGGSTRQLSVLNALEHIKKSGDTAAYVLIHDGARPFVTTELIQEVLQATQKYEAATPGITPTDTIKGLDDDGFIVTHLVRSTLTAVQTPQGFAFERLYDAHKKAQTDGHEYTDDSEIWGKYCGKVKLVTGDVSNAKVTFTGDIERWIATGPSLHSGSSQ